MQEINGFQFESDLQDLISNKRTESLTLEYKRDSGLKTSTSIVKQVTAMANASGGTIIYGLAEDDEKLYPSDFDPVDFSVYTKETIENKIIDNTDPKFTDFRITQIETKENSSHGYYVINIEQSSTAHQNTIDKKYYIRRNFKSEPMLDYEVEDIKRRNKYPAFDVEFSLTPMKLVLSSGIVHRVGMPVQITNTSSVYAKYIVMKISLYFFSGAPNRMHELKLFNTQNSSYLDIHKGKHQFINPIPILPECSHTWYISLSEYLNRDSFDILHLFYERRDEQIIHWKIYADNAKPNEGEFWMGDLVKKHLDIFS